MSCPFQSSSVPRFLKVKKYFFIFFTNFERWERLTRLFTNTVVDFIAPMIQNSIVLDSINHYCKFQIDRKRTTVFSVRSGSVKNE